MSLREAYADAVVREIAARTPKREPAVKIHVRSHFSKIRIRYD